jgi:hypothetical protein
MRIGHPAAVALLLGFSLAGFLRPAVPTNRMAEVDAEIRKLAAVDGASNVLVVFDIDNTLLTMSQPLGGNAWYEWQAARILADVPDREFADFNQLLEMQDYLFSLGHMTPPEPDIPSLFNRLQRDGFRILLLTGRAPGNAASTVRELRRNGMNTAASAIGPGDGDNRFWKPESVMTPGEKAECVWKEEASEYVFFSNGILFSAGLHKGQMLRLLLRLKNVRPARIVFIDDSPGNTARVESAFPPGTVRAFLYTREAERSRCFSDPACGQMRLATDQLNLLKAAIASGDPARVQLAERVIFGDR